MFLRHDLPQCIRCRLEPFAYHDRRDRNSVRVERFETTPSTPLRCDGWIPQKRFEHRLMVAFECDVFGWKRIVRQSVEHATRIWTPVYIVAQRYRQAARRRIVDEIPLNFPYQHVEQVCATMD